MAGTFPALPVFVGETVMEVCIYLKRGWKDCMISFLRNICSYKQSRRRILFANEAKAAFGEFANKTKAASGEFANKAKAVSGGNAANRAWLLPSMQLHGCFLICQRYSDCADTDSPYHRWPG